LPLPVLGFVHTALQETKVIAAFDNLPPLRQVIENYGLAAKKALGQNFLLDLNLTAKIARQAAALTDYPVIEIGPGPGGLTRALLAQGAFVTVIERDERCRPALEEIGRHYPGRLHCIYADALHYDFAAMATQSPFRQNIKAKPKIIANLPYNIGTELLLNWLLAEPWPPFYQSLTLMFQQEVAARITAGPGDKAYGRLSILCGWRCRAEIVMILPPQAFTPPPKVHSAVVHIVPRENPLPCSAQNLSRLTKAAFGQRRKMLRQSLKQLDLKGMPPNDFLHRAGIDPTQRAEKLTIEQFVILANALDSL